MLSRRHLAWLLLAAAAPGCGAGPHSLRDLGDPSAYTRARALGFTDESPTSVAVPTLLARLQDDDPVVRLTANAALRKRTGQDFGFIAWADDAERAPAVRRWQLWWAEQSTGRSTTALAAVSPRAARRAQRAADSAQAPRRRQQSRIVMQSPTTPIITTR